MLKRLTSPASARIAAQVATVAFAIVILLQLAIAAGIVPITMAWGGTQDVLTFFMRIASIAAAMILALAAYVIRRRAGLWGNKPPSLWIKIFAWLITAYLSLNVLGNFASPSLGETLLFGPISLVLAVACLIVSLSRVDTARG
jgi:hypothetical protein